MEDKLVIVLQKIDSLQTSLNRIDKDLSTDRNELQETRIRLSAMEAQVDEMRKQLKSLLNKTSDRVIEAIAPLQEQIQDRKIIEYISKPWWRFWRR